MCPHCKHQLAAKDLVPVASFVALKGKCRHCSKSISWHYPVVELITAVLFANLWVFFAPSTVADWLQFAFWCVITVLVVAAATHDTLWHVLPDKFLLPAIGIATVVLLIGIFGFHATALWYRFAAAAAFAGFYLILWLVSKGNWIGDGDIRLAFLMGLMLDPHRLLVAIFATYYIGAAVAIVLIITKIKKRKDHIAFGPFLAVGLYVGLFFGTQILDLYRSITGL